jgi:hypothetical protein
MVGDEWEDRELEPKPSHRLAITAIATLCLLVVAIVFSLFCLGHPLFHSRSTDGLVVSAVFAVLFRVLYTLWRPHIRKSWSSRTRLRHL